METTISSGNLQSFLRLLDDKGMTCGRFTAILGSGILADIFDPDADLGNRDAVRAALELGTIMPEIFRLSVDYGMSLEQMIAAGRYDGKNRDINITQNHFQIEGRGIVEFEARYFHFNLNVFSEKAVKWIKQADKSNPWSPAKIEHLLSLGATFPDEQRKFPIVSPGSLIEIFCYHRVPYLSKEGSFRNLYLSWWDDNWPLDCHFLAVRKVSVP